MESIEFLKIMEALNALINKIEVVKTPVSPLQLPTSSVEIDQLSEALALAQGKYKPLVENVDIGTGKFANLDAILGAVKASLSENKLAFFQGLEYQDSLDSPTLLKTVLSHASGQWIASYARIRPGATEKKSGTILEIQKRRQALMVLGIAPSQNDPFAFDDNAELLGDEAIYELERKASINTSRKKDVYNEEYITKEQYEDLKMRLEGWSTLAKEVMDEYQIQTLADLPKSEFYKVRSQITKLQEAHAKHARLTANK